MGMELVGAGASFIAYAGSIIILAVFTPMGIIIGLILNSDDAAKSLTVLVIQVSIPYYIDKVFVVGNCFYNFAS